LADSLPGLTAVIVTRQTALLAAAAYSLSIIILSTSSRVDPFHFQA